MFYHSSPGLADTIEEAPRVNGNKKADIPLIWNIGSDPKSIPCFIPPLIDPPSFYSDNAFHFIRQSFNV
jgi:hypothetical protein